MARRGLGRHVTVSVAVALAIAGVGASACEDHLCDPNTGTWGLNAGEGDLLGKRHWETTPLTGTWVDFRGMETLTLHFEKYFPNCIPYVTQFYISPDAVPSVDGGNSAPAGGNVAETLGGYPPGQLVLFNNTCAEYFLHVVIWCPSPFDGGPDAATPTADATAGKD